MHIATKLPGLIRRSPAQREVFQLYRALLRTVEEKSADAEQREAVKQQIRATFKVRAQWPRQDTETIEAWIKQGWRRQKLLTRSDSISSGFSS